jgi:hypothetical protein
MSVQHEANPLLCSVRKMESVMVRPFLLENYLIVHFWSRNPFDVKIDG